MVVVDVSTTNWLCKEWSLKVVCIVVVSQQAFHLSKLRAEELFLIATMCNGQREGKNAQLVLLFLSGFKSSNSQFRSLIKIIEAAR